MNGFIEVCCRKEINGAIFLAALYVIEIFENNPCNKLPDGVYSSVENRILIRYRDAGKTDDNPGDAICPLILCLAGSGRAFLFI